MKVIRSLTILAPALMLVSFTSFADAGRAPRQAPQQQAQPQYAPPQDQGYPPQQGYPPPVQQVGPGYAQQGYFCGTPCLPPPPLIIVPVPVPVPVFPIVTPYCPPNCGGGGWVGRPGWNGGGYPPRFPPNVYVAPGGTGGFVRRMSATVGCEVQQGNNGLVVVLSASGDVIFGDDSSAASQNAETMRAYYENGNTGLCGAAASSVEKVQSI